MADSLTDQLAPEDDISRSTQYDHPPLRLEQTIHPLDSITTLQELAADFDDMAPDAKARISIAISELLRLHPQKLLECFYTALIWEVG